MSLDIGFFLTVAIGTLLLTFYNKSATLLAEKEKENGTKSKRKKSNRNLSNSN